MKASVLKAALLTALLLLPAASRLRASGDPPDPPLPPAPPAAPAAPAPPVPPDEEEEGPVTVRVAKHSGGYLGVRPLEMTPELRQHFGAPKDAGVLVGSVEADSPASRGGLQVGDIVTALDGNRIESDRELQRDVRRRKPGETVKIEIVRNRAPRTLTITVGKRPAGLEVGDLGDMPRFRFKRFEGLDLPDGWIMPPRDFRSLERKLEELEKRLEELETRFPAR